MLIDQNNIGLELAEIEGDALFFYKVGDGVSVEKLVNQVRTMYEAFHQHLQLYKYRRICNCGACTNAEGLQLKFVVHEALIDFIDVKGTRKPFGEEVIKVHRLLKNNVPLSEYLLVSDTFLERNLSQMNSSMKQDGQAAIDRYDFGDFSYSYFSLDHFNKKIDLHKQLAQPKLGRHVLSSQQNVNVSPNELFQFILDFEHRHRWSVGVDKVNFKEGEINQVGSKHTCVIGGSHLELATIFKDEKEDELIFIENTKDAPLIKDLSTVFKVKPGPLGSQLDVEMYTQSSSLLGKLITPILRSKLKANQKKSLTQLKMLFEHK